MKSILACLVILATLGCSKPLALTMLKAGGRPDAPLLLILQSQRIVRHEAAARAFATGLGDSGARLAAVTLNADTGVGDIQTLLETTRPQFIFALGSQAAMMARDATQEIPVLFAMALTYRLHELDQGPNMMGVSMELPPVNEFVKFKIVMPDLKKVTVLYTQGVSESLIKEAQASLQPIGVEIVAVPVLPDQSPVEALSAQTQKTDALWLMSDPVMQSFAALQVLCEERKLPIVTSLSNAFAHSGALMSVAVDVTSIGAQAAGIARLVLERGSKPHDIGVQYPNSATFVLNMSVAEVLGIEVPLDILPYVDEIVENQVLAAQTPGVPTAP